MSASAEGEGPAGAVADEGGEEGEEEGGHEAEAVGEADAED